MQDLQIQYFIKKSSDNHKILLDAELEQHGLTLDHAIEANQKEESLSLLNKLVTDIYNQFDFKINHISLSKKEQIYQWASDGILAVKVSLEQAVTKLKQRVIFVTNRPVYKIGNVKPAIEVSPTKSKTNGKYVIKRIFKNVEINYLVSQP